MPAARLVSYAEAGRAWVAVDADDRPEGYVVVDVLDGCAHIEQISVAPEAQGRGLARALLDEVACWAQTQGMPALTLTTFTDVPWNAPLYAHLGFEVVEEADLADDLRGRRDEEAGHGLDPDVRCCMRRDLRLSDD